ncbi:MAG: metalloregulator ArsR/SmtB family transcription factor [bacterium]|nr:metalloregulator ArsR/SmtB family transcription factor [bacterium]MDD5755820.1 metalloregulator ArsR/SmtB family transcription factor [bacterium]
MGAKKFKRQAQLFKMLANPVRLEILQNLSKRKVCVNSLSELVSRRQANISQHLSIMKNMGIIDSQRAGKKQCYFITNHEIKKLVEKIKS